MLCARPTLWGTVARRSAVFSRSAPCDSPGDPSAPAAFGIRGGPAVTTALSTRNGVTAPTAAAHSLRAD